MWRLSRTGDLAEVDLGKFYCIRKRICLLWLLLFFFVFDQFVRFLFEGGFYSKKYGTGTLDEMINNRKSDASNEKNKVSILYLTFLKVYWCDLC